MEKLIAEKINKKINNYSILNTVSLTIEKGSIHVIEGKSGSGKSTLLSILGGMDTPSSGEVLWKGRNLYKMSDPEQSYIRGKEFGFIFQSFHLLPELTARQNILLPMKMNKNIQIDEEIDALALDLGIDNIMDRKVMYLSGGEQQRVAIGRAIISSPSIIFADEPTGNLDDKTSEQIVELLLKLNKKKDISLVIVTHEKELIKEPHFKYLMKSGSLKNLEWPDV